MFGSRWLPGLYAANEGKAQLLHSFTGRAKGLEGSYHYLLFVFFSSFVTGVYTYTSLIHFGTERDR